jgi:hypothetical protein
MEPILPKLSKDITNIITKYYGLTRQIILKTETILYDKYKNNDLILLISNIDGTFVEGLFSTKEKATQFMIRNIINCLILEREDDEDLKRGNFQQQIQNNLENYELININWLDKNLPIYVSRNGNGNSPGSSSEYLTHQGKHWKIKYYNYRIDLLEIDRNLDDIDDSVEI